MSNRFSVALLALAAVLAHAHARALDVCVDKARPSAKVDAQLAQALAKADGATPRVHYYDGRGHGDDDFSLHDFKGLLGSECKLVVGFPYEAANGELPKYLKASTPYARTGFVLVTRKDSPYSTLAAMPQGSHVAVAYNTLPNYYFRHHANLERDIVADESEALADVVANKVAGAMLWRGAVAHELEHGRKRAAFRQQPIDEPNSQWGLVALYASGDEETPRRFDAAIAKLRADGTLARTLGGYADTLAGEAPRADDAAAQIATPRLAPPRSARTCASVKGKAKAKAAASKAPPALFTQAQVDEGKALFATKCALCHAPDLTGRAGPALKGKFFADPSHKYTIRDIFTIVSQNMPATQPGSLTHDEYVKLMSFILQQNGYPAGDKELTFDDAKASKVPLRYYGE